MNINVEGVYSWFIDRYAFIDVTIVDPANNAIFRYRIFCVIEVIYIYYILIIIYLRYMSYFMCEAMVTHLTSKLKYKVVLVFFSCISFSSFTFPGALYRIFLLFLPWLPCHFYLVVITTTTKTYMSFFFWFTWRNHLCLHCLGRGGAAVVLPITSSWKVWGMGDEGQTRQGKIFYPTILYPDPWSNPRL